MIIGVGFSGIPWLFVKSDQVPNKATNKQTTQFSKWKS
jgi:hypothetical protein